MTNAIYFLFLLVVACVGIRRLIADENGNGTRDMLIAMFVIMISAFAVSYCEYVDIKKKEVQSVEIF